ncbi:MAG: ribosome biogenesis GTPase Der [Patescibacteria group bacterium]|jgi:GTP-binding protein
MNTKLQQQPKVAIVGRPNVGKSTFFNRIVGKRRAIESEIPGTTRDRIYADADWCGKAFTLIDTAGLTDEKSGDELVNLTEKSAKFAIEQADIIVFIIDQAEISASDKKIAKTLHSGGKKTFLVANKADNSGREIVNKEMFSLGFGEPSFVSAISGRGVADFLDKLTSNFDNAQQSIKKTLDIKVAIIGRPNVGKSTLLNSLSGQEKAVVSTTPGTTRDTMDEIITHKGKTISFVDTAGIRRRGKVESGIEKFSIIRTMSAIKNSEVVVVLVDADEGLTNQDTHIVGEAKEQGKSIIIGVNKFDLLDGENDTDQKNKMSEILGYMQENLAFVPFVPVIFISAREKQNLNVLLNKIVEIHDQRYLEIDKSVLKKVIKEALEKNPQLPKIIDFYQNNTNPIVFKLVSKNPKLFHFSHLRYLENRIRDNFPFMGTPIFIDLITNKKSSK